ncbi:nuclear pore complex protein NUP88-like [Salvia splendens]|nr:nuclear pore complex protein NUP88-like [Salvia splendens]
MRFSFDLTEGRQSPTPSPSSSTPKSELEWFPLQNHPLFSSATATPAAALDTSGRKPPNLMAWDGASRLYIWDLKKKCLHRLSIRLGEPDPSSILAASPSKVLQAETPVSFEVSKISINKNGSAMLLAGTEGLCVMYLYGRSSLAQNTIICRTASLGSEIYFQRNDLIRILQICWHPYSDTHLGILSSDSVFRIFDLSTDIGQPEQEYYLQPVEYGSSRNAAAICPVDFSFGGEHLWDKFSVFILFSDGSTYIICPVVPFASLYKWESILELYNDAHTFGLKSADSKAVSNSNMAISWLEATFPELVHQDGGGGQLHFVRAQPFVHMDASVSLQGPLHNMCDGVTEDSDVQKGTCEGRAVSFHYNLVGKDTILVIARSDGQLQLDALADEIQPVWTMGSAPRLCFTSSDKIAGVAMICESFLSSPTVLKLDQTPYSTAWLGQPPPLLRLAIVDLALPIESSSLIGMISDPLLPERTFCIHAGGIDSIVLHFLPFTNHSTGKEEPIRTPSVNSVLSTCPGDSSSPSPLHGFLALSDSYGSSWIVGLTSSNDCIVLQMETWNVLLTDAFDKIQENLTTNEKTSTKQTGSNTIISKELLSGPKAVLLPPSAPNLRSVTADSIEGRSMLHQYFKLFHENYVEYAHKVHFELQRHAPQLKNIIDGEHSRLHKMQQKLLEIETNQEKLEDRVDRAVKIHSSLEERLKSLRSLPGLQKNPLSKAEREFKMELDKFTGLELDALHSSIEALSARTKRYTHSLQADSPTQRTQRLVRRGNRVPDDGVSELKSLLEKLSLINSENSKKVKLVESALKTREITD